MVTKEYIRLADIYMNYPYKKRDGLNITRPYIKKKDEVEHEFQISYSEWKKILLTYFSVIIEYVFDGNRFKFPSRLGILYAVKSKKGFIRKFRKNDKKEIFFNFETNGYVPRTKWESSLRLKSVYKFRFAHRVMRYWHKRAMQDKSIILNLPDNV